LGEFWIAEDGYPVDGGAGDEVGMAVDEVVS
jgi:hypothetical protein